jgi:hypothetical protein
MLDFRACHTRWFIAFIGFTLAWLASGIGIIRSRTLARHALMWIDLVNIGGSYLDLA